MAVESVADSEKSLLISDDDEVGGGDEKTNDEHKATNGIVVEILPAGMEEPRVAARGLHTRWDGFDDVSNYSEFFYFLI
jgi:hypothetical protein